MSARRGTATVLSKEARGAAAEAALLRLLGLLFERPRRGWAGEVRSLAGGQADGRLRDAAAEAQSATEGEYLRLFGPGGSASPREVAYRGLADPGRILAGLSALYDAFAFQPRAEDPRDHIAVEVGFAGYLAMKEAYLLTARDRQGAARVREARTLLLTDHLRPFAAGIGARLAGAGAPPYISSAAGILAEWTGCDPHGGNAVVADGTIGGVDADAALACAGCGEGASGVECGPPAADQDGRRR